MSRFISDTAIAKSLGIRMSEARALVAAWDRQPDFPRKAPEVGNKRLTAGVEAFLAKHYGGSLGRGAISAVPDGEEKINENEQARRHRTAPAHAS